MHESDWRRETREDTEEQNRVFILVMSSCLHGFHFQLGFFVLLAAFHAHSGFNFNSTLFRLKLLKTFLYQDVYVKAQLGVDTHKVN